VVYDDGGGAAAARAWWVLKWAGIESVRILDGGYPVWAGHGQNETGVPPRRKRKDRGNITLSAGHMPTVEADEVEAFNGIVIDAREAHRYRGEFEPIDPRAGHIPGALNLPVSENFSPSGKIKTEDELQDNFSQAGVSTTSAVAVYCGSGVAATHHVAVLASLGIDAALFPGSWSQWVSDPHREIGRLGPVSGVD
ncbi:MAG TPA: rhodanese-like domain-containing protein, partial [Beutenbergiaceae bacterium]|nr:rhodanese-like domain-containing protein [Beutenbergiaceae bacterium]